MDDIGAKEVMAELGIHNRPLLSRCFANQYYLYVDTWESLMVDSVHFCLYGDL